MNYVNLNKGLASALAGPLIQSYGKSSSEIVGKTYGEIKAGVEAEVLFKGDERAQVGERRLPIYSETIGVVFKSVSGKPGERVEASYALQADDLYVRAIVESSEAVTGYAKRSHQHPQHPQAWTQPLRRKFSP